MTEQCRNGITCGHFQSSDCVSGNEEYTLTRKAHHLTLKLSISSLPTPLLNTTALSNTTITYDWEADSSHNAPQRAEPHVLTEALAVSTTKGSKVDLFSPKQTATGQAGIPLYILGRVQGFE